MDQDLFLAQGRSARWMRRMKCWGSWRKAKNRARERRKRKAGASSPHSKRWREFVHGCQVRREAFGVRPGLPALFHTMFVEVHGFNARIRSGNSLLILLQIGLAGARPRAALLRCAH